MSQQTFEPKKWVILGLGVASFLLFLVLKEVNFVVWDYFRLPQYDQYVLALPVWVSIGLAALCFFVLVKNQKIYAFLSEVAIELSKVVWPAGKETGLSSVIVSVMVAIAAVIIGIYDGFWGFVMKKIFEM